MAATDRPTPAAFVRRLPGWVRHNQLTFGLGLVVLLGLILISQANYLLFHTLAELFSIVIAFTIFVLTWNSLVYLRNSYLVTLGISFLFVGTLDLLHTLAFRGMGVFPGTGIDDPAGANLATQLWLSARYLQAITVIVAPILAGRRIRMRWLLGGYLLVTTLVLLSIAWGWFPDSYLTRITPFKIISEYVIILLFLIGILLLDRVRQGMDPTVRALIIASFAVNALAELAFTEYLAVTDYVNQLGHFLKIVSFFLIYKAIIETGFRQPHNLMFHELQQSEARLRARATQMEAIMDSVPALVWISHDAQSTQVTSNRAAVNIFGTQKPGWPATAPRPLRVFDKNGRELHLNQFPLQRAASTGQPVLDFEERVIFDDGQQLYLFGNSVPLLDEKGQSMGAVTAMTDITGRVLAERAMRESEQRYRGLFETMVEAFSLYEPLLDENGSPTDFRVLEANPAFETLTGVQRDQLIGRPISELLPIIDMFWIERYAHVAKTGETLRFEEYSPLLDKYFEVLVFRVGENQVASLSVDVTERRRSQEAQRQSEARLRRLVDSNIIGFIYTRPEGQVTLANDAFLALVGYTRADLEAGKVNWRQMSPPEYRTLDEDSLAEVFRRGACSPYQKEFIRSDGETVPVLIGYAHFEGDPSPLIGFVLDLTEQKKAEEAVREYASRLEISNRDLERAIIELEWANRELQDFAFVASHDLQEPLRKIQAFGERISERLSEQFDEETRDYMQRMLNAAYRMRVMINDLLLLSRVTTRGKPFVRADLNQVAAEVLSDLEVRIERSGGKVEVGQLPVLDADLTQMHQLLQNLISNGLKFQRPGVPPHVRVSGECSPDGRRATITVEDNGIGFEQQYQDRIFQPFQRLHGVGQYEGSGMGLAICRKIAERHAGKIEAYGTPGEGAKFVVTLPVKARQSKKVVSE